MMDFERILYMGRELEASDIHMTAGQPLLIRQQGRLAKHLCSLLRRKQRRCSTGC